MAWVTLLDDDVNGSGVSGVRPPDGKPILRFHPSNTRREDEEDTSRSRVVSRSMSEFTVTGTFPARFGEQAFEKTLDAPNENVAVEHVYTQFGSQHGLKRTQISIDEVSA
jgi:large subunit ribosomal protein LX